MTTTPDTRPVVEIIANTLMALHRREPLEPTTAHRQARRIEKALAGADKLKGDPMTTTPNPTAEEVAARAITEWFSVYQSDRNPLVVKIVAALRDHGKLSEGAPSEEQIERAARALFEDPSAPAEYTWAEMVDEDPSRADIWREDARRVLTAAGVAPQEPSAHANPLATSGERVRNQADSSHDATQEPSPVASTPTVSDDSGHGGDDDRGGREDGPEDEGRSHQATVAGTPQRPSGCAECGSGGRQRYCGGQ